MIFIVHTFRYTVHWRWYDECGTAFTGRRETGKTLRFQRRLGTNLGNRKRNIREVIEKIGEQIGVVERQSALYETKPWGYSSPNDYINACVLVLTTMAPRQVLEATQRIEREMGRTMKSVDSEYHDRIIDIDILMIDDLVIDEPDFKVPHPLMEEREFVMKPLKEILR